MANRMNVQNVSPAIAVIQARMGSSRFPGKMLATLCGRPLISHIIARAKAIAAAREVVLATSVESKDEAFVRVAQESGIRVVRGSERNVLERYLAAIELTGAKYIA